MTKLNQSFIILLMVISMISCKDNQSEYHNLIDKIEAQSIAYQKDSVFSNNQFEISELVKIVDNQPAFYIKNRKNEIESYACSECHDRPLDQLQTENLGKRAHWDIKLIHADSKTMSCLSCHSENNLDNLHSITGENIDFNFSYQLCNQCHNKEVKDWKGGAHGKNLSGWKTSRVSKLCVECHNPHKPSIEKRWPDRFNTKMVDERK